MKRMSKSAKREFAWLMPTKKRLKMVEKKALNILADVYYLNNECCELIEIERSTAIGYHPVNITLISDNLSYMVRYANSLVRIQKEFSECYDEIRVALETDYKEYRLPLLLKIHLKKSLYVSELLLGVVGEITNVFDDLSEEYEGLLMEKLERCR